MLSHFRCVRLCATLWTVASWAPLSMGIFWARIPEWVAMPSSRGSSWPRIRTGIVYVSCIGRWVLYHWCHLRSPSNHFYLPPFVFNFRMKNVIPHLWLTLTAFSAHFISAVWATQLTKKSCVVHSKMTKMNFSIPYKVKEI